MQCHGGMVPLRHRRRPADLHDRLRPGRRADRLRARRATTSAAADIIASDMGGTSFDVGIIKDGEPLAADEHPARQVALPRAGGRGDLDRRRRRLDRLDRRATAAACRVGPQSASSLPGPACYDRGGTEPTVTDADLVLGYIAPEATFGSKGERGGFQPRPRPGRAGDPGADRRAARALADRRRARHRRGRQREDGQRAGERDHRPRLRPARLRAHVLRRRRPLPRRRLRAVARHRHDRRPRRGGLGLVGLRHLPGGHPLPVRGVGGADRAVRPPTSVAAAPSSELEARGARGARRARGRRARSSSAATRGCASSGSATSSRCGCPTATLDAPSAGGDQTPSSSASTPSATARPRCCRARAARSSRSGWSRRSRWAPPTLDRLEVAEGEEFRKGTRPVYFERGAGAVETAVYNGDAMPLGEARRRPGGDRPGDHRASSSRPAPAASAARPATSS